jgi:hypothetical protein
MIFVRKVFSFIKEKKSTSKTLFEKCMCYSCLCKKRFKGRRLISFGEKQGLSDSGTEGLRLISFGEKQGLSDSGTEGLRLISFGEKQGLSDSGTEGLCLPYFGNAVTQYLSTSVPQSLSHSVTQSLSTSVPQSLSHSVPQSLFSTLVHNSTFAYGKFFRIFAADFSVCSRSAGRLKANLPGG